MKKIVLLLFIMFLTCSLFSSVLPEAIYYADHEELGRMLRTRGLLESGSDEEMKTRLYEYEGLSEYKVEEKSEEEEKKKYTLTVLSADKVETDKKIVTLYGSVSILFSTEGESDKTLSATRIIVDSERMKVTALGNASFKDSNKDASLKEISADIFTYLWEGGELSVSGGTTKTERTNEDKEKVSYFTKGELIDINKSGDLIFEGGFISSGGEDALSSVNAKNIALVSLGDMFLSSSTFKIGRIPFFYLPFYVSPGSRILGNPSFGFDSEKGAFVNMTFEIFGSYSKIKQDDSSFSFSSMVKNGEEVKDLRPVGFYYDEKEEDNFSSWAKKSKSYLVIMLDTYSGAGTSILPSGGIHLALDSTLNLFNNKFMISLLDGIAISKPVLGERDYFRFYGNNKAEYSDFGLSFSLSLPFYSDSLVLKDFQNRNTSFSISPLFSSLLGGKENFETSGGNTISSYSQVFKLSYSLPSQYRPKIISNLSISTLELSVDYKSKNNQNENASRFIISSFSLPVINASISGTLFDFSFTPKKKEVESVSNEETKETVHDVIYDSFVPKLYKDERNDNKNIMDKELSRELNFKVSYSLNEKASNTLSTTDDIKSSSRISTTTTGKFELLFSFGDFIALSNSFVPYLAYTNNKKYESVGGGSDDVQDKSKENSLTFTGSSEVGLSSSLLGLSYSLSLKFFDYQKSDLIGYLNGVENSKETKDESVPFSWDNKNVLKHSLSFSKDFSLSSLGTFSPKVDVSLPPREMSITPIFGWENKGWKTNFSWLFKEHENKLGSDKISLTLSYSSTFFSFSFSGEYQSKDFNKAKFFDPLKLNGNVNINTNDKAYSLSESIEYSVLSPKGDYYNYFSTIKTELNIWKIKNDFSFGSVDGSVKFKEFNISLSLPTSSFQFWKGRVYFSLLLDSKLHFDVLDISKSYFNISLSLNTSIAEFMDMKLSVSSENTRLERYFVKKTNEFMILEMFDDLLRSFDFFDLMQKNSRNNTAFVLKSISLEFVHYMSDWNLKAKFSTELGKFPYNKGSKYTLVPSLSISLSWKTLPDIKDEENWSGTLDNNGETVWVKK